MGRAPKAGRHNDASPFAPVHDRDNGRVGGAIGSGAAVAGGGGVCGGSLDVWKVRRGLRMEGWGGGDASTRPRWWRLASLIAGALAVFLDK